MPEFEHFPYICLLFAFPPGALQVYKPWDLHAFFLLGTGFILSCRQLLFGHIFVLLFPVTVM